MTREQKDTLWRWLIALFAIPLLALVDHRYVKTEDYRAHQVSDSAWKADQSRILLDVLCSPSVNPTNRRCR